MLRSTFFGSDPSQRVFKGGNRYSSNFSVSKICLYVKGEPKKKFLFENTRIVLLFLEIFHNFSPYLTNNIPTSKLRTLYLPSDFQKVIDFQRYMRLFQNILLRFGIKQSVTEQISDVLSKIRVSELSFCKEQMQSLYSPQKNVTDRLLDFQNPI